MNKTDPRYINAEAKIMDAAFVLFSQKDIDTIRTKEIISAAGVNKSTFYSHYRDKYALLESIEKRLSDEFYPHLEGIFVSVLSENKDIQKLNEYYEWFISYIFENKELFSIILQRSHGTNIIERITSEIENIWEKQKIADPKTTYNSYLINAIVYVMIGTIEKWLQRDCKDSPEDIRKLIIAAEAGIRDAFEFTNTM